MARRTRWLALGLAMALSLATVSCSSGDDEGPTTGEDGDVLPGTAAIGIADLAYEPSTLSVARGNTEITITNSDSTDHTFTLDSGDVDETIAAGATVKVTVSLETSAGFHCEIHSSMTGTLVVE